MRELLKRHGIEEVAYVPLDRCKVLRPYLLERNGLDTGCGAVIMLIPYRPRISPVNLSVYASVRDYHAFARLLSREIEEYAREKYPDARVKVFADHSPVDEVHCASLGGLGVIGRNGLLINERYSSFVFLCEIITDLTPERMGMEGFIEREIGVCADCGACERACPSHCMDKRDPRPKKECLSAITQKKGELTAEEEQMILDSGCLWGCDICQNACPYTARAEYTPIEYFNTGVIPRLTEEHLCNMTEEEFSSRPFSWRGKEVVMRNLRLGKGNLR